MELAWKKFRKKDFDGAQKVFSSITQEDPAFGESLYGHIGCLMRKKEYTGALDLLDDMGQLNPEDHTVYHLRALCHGGNTDYNKAIKNLEKAIELGGDRHDLYYDMGGTYLVMKDFQRAAQCFEKCIDLDGKCHEAWVGKALVAWYTKSTKAAMEFASISLKLHPKNLPALLIKADIFLESGNKKELEKEVKKILSIDPDIFKNPVGNEEPLSQMYDEDDSPKDEDANRSEDDEIEEFNFDE